MGKDKSHFNGPGLAVWGDTSGIVVGAENGEGRACMSRHG